MMLFTTHYATTNTLKVMKKDTKMDMKQESVMPPPRGAEWRNRRRRKNMGTDTYMVLIDKSIVAMALSLEHAVVLVKALFNEYYAEPGLTISIQREPKEDAR